MRFVIGLLCGAMVILLLAQVSGAPDGGWLARAPVWFDRLATSAGDLLALPPRPSRTPPPSLPTGGAETVAESLPLAALPAEQPIPRPPDPWPLDGAETGADTGADIGDGTGDGIGEAGSDQWADGVEPEPRRVDGVASAAGDGAWLAPPGVAPVPGLVAMSGSAPAALEPGLQPVWTPFHSRLSARGFAAQLSASLGHPFRVERRGPGSYQVVFGYRDEPQRQALLAEAAQLTGLQL